MALEVQVESGGMQHHSECHPTPFWACLCGYAVPVFTGIVVLAPSIPLPPW